MHTHKTHTTYCIHISMHTRYTYTHTHTHTHTHTQHMHTVHTYTHTHTHTHTHTISEVLEAEVIKFHSRKPGIMSKDYGTL